MKKTMSVLSLLLIFAALTFLLYGLKPETASYALGRRIPALAAMAVTGAAVGASSILFQTITANRILTPSILGLDSLYVLILTGGMFLGGSLSRLGPLADFAISILVMVAFSVLILGGFLKLLGGDVPKLLLCGIITGTLFKSGSAFLQVLMDPNEYLVLQTRLFASFNNIPTVLVAPAALLLGLTLVYILRRAPELDVMTLGKNQAVELGLAYDRLVRTGLIACALLVAVSTALVGPVTFLGVLVSNLARETVPGIRHRQLLPAGMLIGAASLILGQFVTGNLLRLETPVSVLINFIGGLYFIYLLLRGNRA